MLRSPWFPIGLYWGLAAVTVALTWGCISRFSRKRPAPIAAILMAGATFAALEQIEGTHVWLMVALVALVAGAALATVLGLSPGIWPLLLAPGALVLAYRSGPEGPAWVSHLVFVAVLFGSALAVHFDHRDRLDSLGPAVALMSIGGLFLCTPDTDQALVLLGASVLVGMTGWPLRLTRLGSIGAPAWVGLFMWIMATGGIARLSPMLAGVACLGVLALEPAAVALHSRMPRVPPERSPARSAILVLGAHLLFVLVASRVAGIRSPLDRTILVLAVSTVAAMAILLGGLQQMGRRLPRQEETIDKPVESDAGPPAPGESSQLGLLNGSRVSSELATSALPGKSAAGETE